MELTILKFICDNCSEVNYTWYETGEGDCLEYNCNHCETYYKKRGRIPDENVLQEEVIDLSTFFDK